MSTQALAHWTCGAPRLPEAPRCLDCAQAVAYRAAEVPAPAQHAFARLAQLLGFDRRVGRAVDSPMPTYTGTATGLPTGVTAVILPEDIAFRLGLVMLFLIETVENLSTVIAADEDAVEPPAHMLFETGGPVPDLSPWVAYVLRKLGEVQP